MISEEVLMKKKGAATEESRKLFGIRLTPSLVKALKLQAVKQDTHVNRLIEEIVTDYLKRKKAL